MKKNKLMVGAFALASTALLLTGCKKTKSEEFTFHDYTSALATNWNPHTWETNADNSVLSYLSEGFVSLAPKDTEAGEYQWVFDMAESIEDVTKDSKDALMKFHGLSEEQADAFVGAITDEKPGQLVYQIKLRDDLKWDDGTEINADSFIKSAEHLLDPKMKNYRANLFVAGESAIVGGEGFFYQGSITFIDNLSRGVPIITSVDELELVDGVYHRKDNGLRIEVRLNDPLMWLGGDSLKTYVEFFGDQFFDLAIWGQLLAAARNDKLEEANDPFILKLTEDNLELFMTFLDKTATTDWQESRVDWVNYAFVEEEYPEVEFAETVGLYKPNKDDNLTFNYVMANRLDKSQALVSFSSTWLVHEDAYKANMSDVGELTTTTYNTSLASTRSYGPYKLQSLEPSKQMVLVQNENWHGFTKGEDGKLTSMTNFKVDGEFRPQYVTTKLVIDVLDNAAAKQRFLAGKLSNYTPTADELPDYTLSDSLYQVDETYTMSYFFNTNLNHLKAMDQNEGNKNSVVLSNRTFRKAMSLAIDRAEFVTKTAAYKPAYSLLNDLYYYDVWNNPKSVYRKSEPAMQAIVDLYGIEYGEGKAYATLEEAYKSVNGYNLTEAKLLMKQAFTELTEGENPLYKAGEEIKIRIGYTSGAIESTHQAQVSIIEKHINAALEGSGFGKITLEPIGNLEDRYADVPAGKFAIGYGAWGGAAFYPFRNMQVYCDPDQYDVNEIANWDPTTEKLTISFDNNGEEFEQTMTWQAWSNALVGNGQYAQESNEFKLKVTAIMEREYLDFYYRIPLASSTSAFLLSKQVKYYTEKYNIMYDFGGFRLLTFTMNDAEWAKFVKNSGGTLDYK